MKLEESLRRVFAIWNKECLKLIKPASEKEINEKLITLNTLIARDVVKVYSTLGGMDDGETDAVCFSFWGIEQILKENNSNSEFISFADFLIYSHLYYFKFENEAKSSIHIDGENGIEKIADSFAEFFENYLIKPEEYYLFEREENKKEKKTVIQL